MWQTRSCARAFQACSSPPFCKYYQLAKNQKIALGPAVKKAYHSQREIYQFRGFLQQLCIFTDTIGKGLQGVLPHSSQLPLACCLRSGDQNMYSCLVLTSHDAHVISRVC